MKKIKGFVFGGLQQKIFNLVILVMVLVVAAFLAVTLYQSRELKNAVTMANQRQQESISETSSGTMAVIISGALTKDTALQAEIADDLFQKVKENVTTLGGYVRTMYQEKDEWPPDDAFPPDPETDGRASAQLITEEGIDLTDPKVMDAVGMLGNMDDLMVSMYTNSGQLNSCFVASPEGVVLIADDRPSAKVDEKGQVLHLPVRERPWYVGAVKRGSLYFTDVELDAFTGQVGIVCSMPVYAGGELVAVVGADLFLDSMAESIASGGDSNFSVVINQDGHVIFSPRTMGTFALKDSDHAVDLRLTDNHQLSAFVRSALDGVTDVQLINVDGEDYYMSGAPLKTVGWAELSLVSRAVTEAPTQQMLAHYKTINEETLAAVNNGVAGSLKTLIVLLVIIFLAATGMALFVAQRIVKPLGVMTNRVVSLGGNDLEFQMEKAYRTGDEIEALAESFAKLSKKTLQYVAEVTRVTAEKERIGAELNVATQIQADMLPRIFPALPGRSEIELYASMDPAKEVGGDFYDFFLTDDDHLALVMADVSGKGVPAALFMVIAKTLIKNRAMMGGTPSEILSYVNDQLCEGNEADLFVTVWLAIISISTGKGISVNAGHEHPTIRKAGGKYELMVYRHSPAVATMEGLPFREREFELEPGDSLFVYTDGVAEATDSSEELFGTERMLEALNRDPDAAPEQILKNVRAEIDGFVGEAEQFDDITMLCMRYVGPDKKKLE